jgi:hypothetical protein
MSRRALTLLAVLICTSLQSGCTIWQSTRRTMRQEPHEFSWEHDRGTSKTLYLSWADTVWQEARGYCTPENQSSYDYEWGFREGFAEYCFAGGNGEPPGAPPRPYWHAFKRMSPERNKVDQWYSGYRHGAKVARTGGYRDQAILRSPLVNCSCALPAATSTTISETSPLMSAPVAPPTVVAPEVIAPPQNNAAPQMKPAPAGTAPVPAEKSSQKLDSTVSLPAVLPRNPLPESAPQSSAPPIRIIPPLELAPTSAPSIAPGPAKLAPAAPTPMLFPLELATERSAPKPAPYAVLPLAAPSGTAPLAPPTESAPTDTVLEAQRNAAPAGAPQGWFVR